MSADVLTIQSAVADIITEMLSELDLESDDPIGSSTRLIADLGFASVDFIQLIVELEGHFQRKFGFHDLIMPNGQYVEDLTVGELVAFIQHRLEGPILCPPSTHRPAFRAFLSALTRRSLQRISPPSAPSCLPQARGENSPKLRCAIVLPFSSFPRLDRGPHC